MIETKLPEFKLDLEEEVDMFPNGKDLSVRHLFDRKDNRIVNTVIVNGRSYSFGNLMPETKDETEEKRYLKRYAKLAVYKALSANLGVKLPWGSLTGIRPTKLAYQELEKNGEFTDFFVNTMKVSEEKTLLTEKVINTQKGIYRKHNDFTDFFVFIPFCPSRCKYCSFITADVKSAAKLVDAYVDALIKEIRESKPLIKQLRSIYVGGGTPVALADDKLEKVLSALDEINTGVEFTVEAGRPDRITEENVKMLLRHKVTRICVNPQTFNDKTLKRIGRNHTASDIIEKYNLVKDKFVVNMDLIAGLDGETLEDFKHSLDKTISLNPDNITVHTLCVKKGSVLAEETERLSAESVNEMMEYAHSALQKAGYSPYYIYRQKYMAGNLENAGYCKNGKICVYNVDVMEEICDNIACGAGAISKFVKNDGEKIIRVPAPKDVAAYIEKTDNIIRDKFAVKGDNL